MPTQALTDNIHNLGRSAGRSLHHYLYRSSSSSSSSSTPLVFVSLSSLESFVLAAPSSAFSYALTLPPRYKAWWTSLLTDDPIHVLIETVLVVFVLYMILARRRDGDWRKTSGERLSREEEDELLVEWKERGRGGLVPKSEGGEEGFVGVNGLARGVIVERVVGSRLYIRETTGDDEDGDGAAQTKEDGNDEQQAEDGGGAEKKKGEASAAASAPPQQRQKRQHTSRAVLNFATHDFLGMSSCPDEDEGEGGEIDDTDADDDAAAASEHEEDGTAGGKAGDNDGDDDDENENETEKPEPPPSSAPTAASSSSSGPTASTSSTEQHPPTVKYAARSALLRYGCGSCGPRGFYGTIDAHLDLEKSIAAFTHTQGAIMYSDGASACTSTVAAFSKRGDLLVVDEGVYEALGTGVTLSRANVRYFKRNDMKDLRRVLERIEATDRRLGRKSRDQRRFIVAEGVYKNYGTVAPLDEIVALKREFRYRLILDESHSFGTLGATGRGAVEHFGLRPMVDVEIITISLENTLGSIGGVTVGNEEVVDHQRLSGAGYCFSASAPPFTARAAAAALERMRSMPEALLGRLKSNRERMLEALEGRDEDKVMWGVVPERLIVASDPLSPIVFLRLASSDGGGDDDLDGERDEQDNNLDGWTREEQSAILDEVAASCLRRGVALVSTGGHVTDHLHTVPPPALRLTLSAAQSAEDVDEALRVLREAVLEVFAEEEE